MGIIRITDGAIEKMNRSRSARFDELRTNIHLQAAVRNFINERHDSFRRRDKAYEVNQRIKDDLRLITKNDDTLAFPNKSSMMGIRPTTKSRLRDS